MTFSTKGIAALLIFGEHRKKMKGYFKQTVIEQN